MKYLWTGVLVAALFVACGSDDKGSNDANSEVQLADGNGNQSDGANLDLNGQETGDKDLPGEVDDSGTTDALGQCENGKRTCVSQNEVAECQGGMWVVVAICPANYMCSQSKCVQLADCEPGFIDGCYSLNELKVCNQDGTAFVPELCPGEEKCVEGACSLLNCFPGQSQCLDSGTKQTCKGDGSGWNDPEPCPDGLNCVGGKCLSQCLTDPKWANSYIGCEYWTVDLDNYHDPFSSIPPDEALHGVIIGNPGTAPASVTFTSIAVGINLTMGEVVVQPGTTEVVELPRMDIDGSGIFDRSIKITSNRPVVVYQFNPLDFQGAYSDDSSLLIPAEMLGNEYFIITLPTSPLEAMPMIPAASQHGYFTVVAVEEGTTTVTTTLAAKCEPTVEGAAKLEKGSTHEFQLQQYEVLSLEASGASLFPVQDLTGTHVIADRRIAVFAGHEEAVVEDPAGEGDCCCAEHIEEQFFPVATWSTHYHCVKARSRGAPDVDMWIVQASQAGTTITTEPPIAGLNGQTLNAPGATLTVYTAESFLIGASKPIQVVQILSSQGCTAEHIGDPAMIMAVAQDRYRSEYVFAAPKGYVHDYITVIRQVGVDVLLDDGALAASDFTALPDGTHEYGYFEIADGPHHIISDEPFGLSQYGWEGPASYGNPGGLDLVVTQ